MHRRRLWGHGCNDVRLRDWLGHWDKHMVWAAIVLVRWFPRRNSVRVSFRLASSTHLPKIPSYAMVAVRYRRRTNRSAILGRARATIRICALAAVWVLRLIDLSWLRHTRRIVLLVAIIEVTTKAL